MRRTSGFTLIEVLLSMLIFMAGVTGIYSLFSTALGMQRAGTDTADLTRRLDELVWQLEQDLGQGLHWDEDRGAWRDVESAAFGEGLFYSCRFSPEIGNEHAGTLVATIALARSEAGGGTRRRRGRKLRPHTRSHAGSRRASSPTTETPTMSISIRWACLTVMVCLVLPASGEIIQLRDGTLVHGKIVEFDEATGITIERVDNGGVLSLRWDHLPEAEVQRIKASRGFTGEEAQLYTVQVTHLILRNGTTESGIRVESERADYLSLRRRGSVDSFPKSQVASVQSGRMEGRQVLTPDELYLRLIDEQGEPVDALSHFNLGVACEGAGLLELAQSHFLTTTGLDAELKADLLKSKLSWLEIKIEDAAETKALQAIDHRLYRKQFELAAEMAAAFRDDYPHSRQMADLMELEAEIARRKRTYHGKGITSDYFGLLDRRVARLARDPSLTLDVARELLESMVHEEIMVSLADDYLMSSETVQELWDLRKGGSVRSFNYGTGTFILGKQRALEFGRFDQEDDDESDPEAEIEEEFDDLVERVKRQRQQQAAKRQSASRGFGGGLEDQGPTADEWWDRQSTDDKKRWLLAYYSESSGQLKVIEARPRDCRHCDARGYIEGINEKEEVVQITCPVCKDLKHERLVRCR